MPIISQLQIRGKRKRSNSEDSQSSSVYDTEDDSISDVSSDDETPPIKPLWPQDMEDLPKPPAYDELLSTVRSCLEQQISSLVHTIAGFYNESEAMANSEEKASRLKALSTVEPMRIALLGDSGAGMHLKCENQMPTKQRVGKNSLINSVVDVPTLARQVSITP